MKMIASIFLLSSLSHAAQITTLNCKLDKMPKEIFSFQMENLGKKNMNFVSAEEYAPVFKTDSKNETILRLVDTLNGQGGDLRVHTDKIEFFGDSAGIDFAYLYLYKNSKYTRGYVRIDFDFNTIKKYDTLTCVKTLTTK